MSCPKFLGAICVLETFVKVIGFLSFALTPEINTSSIDFTESLGCS